MKFGVGQSQKRTEDPVLLTGRGRYTDDVRCPDALHGSVFRSPVAHGDISDLDVRAAAAHPGVVAVLTGQDLLADGVGDIACLSGIKNHDGSDHHRTPWPILATDRVRFAGQPVAFVIAETVAAAREAADLIALDIRELPVETDTKAAAAPESPQIWEHIPGNLVFDFAQGDADAVAAAFAGAERIVTLTLVNNRIVSNPMEPRAAVAVALADGRYHLHMPSQGPFFAFNQLSGMVGIAPEDLRVTTGNVGGGFGTRAFLYPEAALTLWAAKRLGRSVRWTGERMEIFLSDAHGRDNVTDVSLAMDAEGHFKALRATTWAAMGAYLSNFGPMIPTEAAVGMYTGLYKIPAAHIRVKGMITNTVPVDAYRGAGRPEAAYLIERLVDVVAREIGLTPDEIRRRNFPSAAEMPHVMGLGDKIDSGDFSGLMAEAMDMADWAGFAERRARSADAGKLRGIGMASYVERCGGGGMVPARLRFEPDGDAITILTGSQDSGQGHSVAFKQILSERLGIDADTISILQGDTAETPPGFTGGSKSIPVGGVSVQGAGDKVIEKGKALAAHMLEAAEADIAYADGTFRITGTDRSVGLFDLARAARDPARLPEGMEPGLDAAHDHTASAPTFPNGCHIVELEVDPETGQVQICRYTVVDDFGLALNPMLLEGQVHGGIAQGIGQAWAEQTTYDPETGTLLSGSLMDYRMPRAEDFPGIAFHLKNTRCTTNPLGVKGAGEAGAIGAPPAFINALVDALHPETGLVHMDMPATPLRIWQALDSGAE
ncbi:MAG: xanthine dehydrogenase family protein molybdopterin-binding subunit [Pseudomonadota bacterium]